jgi:hypothetical protein
LKNQIAKTLGRLGVNLLDDPTELEAEELCKAGNLWPAANGNLGKRPAMRFAQPVLGQLGMSIAEDPLLTYNYNAPLELYQIVGIEDFRFSPTPGVDVVFVTVGANGGRTLWAKQTDTDVLLGKALTAPGPVQLFNFLDVTYCMTGSEVWMVKPGSGTSWAGTLPFVIAQWTPQDTMADGLPAPINANSSLQPRFMDALGDRLVLANLGPGYENSIIFGDPFMVATGQEIDARYSFPPAVLATNGLHVPIGQSDEGPITGIVVGANAPEDYAKQKAVYVFKANAMWTVTGEAPNSLDSSDSGSLDAIRSNLAVGCASHRTIVRTPYGLIWAGLDDVWFMPFGNEPYPIGTKIRPALERQSPQLRYRWHASYFDGAYRLAIFAEGQGPTEYDACEEQWWLDLRKGPPSNFKEARWYGPQKFIPSNAPAGTFAMQVHPTDKKGYALHPATLTYSASPQAVSHMLTLVTMDGRSPYDTTFRQLDARPWAQAETYGVGDVVVPVYNAAAHQMPLAFVCVEAGLSGTVEPTWDDYFGAMSNTALDLVTDGSAVWCPLEKSLAWSAVSNYEPLNWQTDNEVLMDLMTKEWVEPGVEYEKLISSAYLTFWASQWLWLNYSFGMDPENDVKVLDGAANLQRLDSDIFDPTGSQPTTLIREWDARQLPPDPSVRSRANSFQLRVKDVAGIYIEAQFTTLTFYQYQLVGGSYAQKTLQATILNGSYDTIPDLWTSLLGEMSLVATPTLTTGSLTYPNDGQLSVLNWGVKEIGIPLDNQNFGDFNASGDVTAAMIRANRYLMGLLGWGASTGMTSIQWVKAVSGAEFIPGVSKANRFYRRKTVPQVVLKDVTVRYRPFRRNPL